MAQTEIINNNIYYDINSIINPQSFLGVNYSATIYSEYKKLNNTEDLSNKTYDQLNYMFNAIDIYWNNINTNNNKYSERINSTGDLLKFIHSARNFPNSNGINMNSYATFEELDTKIEQYNNLLNNLNNSLSKIKTFDKNKNNNSQ